jgi:pyruvate dehydrogenase E2 component (dihydrolipoamide acetyltransferase)
VRPDVTAQTSFINTEGNHMATEVKLPELAEGVEKGDVVNILVKVGEAVEVDTPLLEIESEKATVALPSPAKGKIGKILVKKGQTVKVGEPVVLIDGAAEPASAAAAPAPEAKAAVETAPAAAAEPAVAASAAPAARIAPPATISDEQVPAGPAVRRIARELGVDLRLVRGSGRNGRIQIEDLDPHIQGFIARRGGAPMMPGMAPVELPDFSKWGPVRREKIDTLRRKISEKMSQSWVTVPHVHQQHDADITELLALQKRHRDRVKELGGSLTLTPFLLKALAIVLKELPQFNASFDERAGEIVYKDHYHIGVAVDTEAGLIVPVVRDVDKKPIVQLAVELSELAQRTRDRKVGLDELRGGTFTVSNLGGIGGGFFNPIINTPEVAILGVGRSAKKPVWKGEAFEPRDILPLCLGYDHRVIDGADGARFVVRLGEILENFEATFLGF